MHTVLPRTGKAVGCDFGLKHFLTADDGSIIDSSEWHKVALEELRLVHRAVSRRQKGRNNRKRAISHLNRLYEQMDNRRRDCFFKLANSITFAYATICIEDLNLAGMKRLWGRKVSNYSFAGFVKILEWSTCKHGSTVVKNDHWAPSSKTCSVCGQLNTNLSLEVREWTCKGCGSLHDRDINAAINIKKVGLATL